MILTRFLLKKTEKSEAKPKNANKLKGQGNLFISRVGNITGTLLLFIFCAVVLALSLRGLPGNPTQLSINNTSWKENGPLELSPERGRFALLYAVAENHTVQLSVALARFAAPDVGYYHGQYVSLFAPAVSFIALPGYMIGKYIGVSQVGSFSIIALFALLNFMLIRAIAIRLGAARVAATIGAFAFLFASPAYAYAVTLYQHHISTFLILFSLYLLIRFRNAFSLALIWILCGLSVSVDYPNFFLMLPIGIMALLRTVPVDWSGQQIRVQLPLLKVVALSALIIPMLFFFWFNKLSYGNPLQLSGTVERSVGVLPDGKPLLESAVARARLKSVKTQKPPAQQEKSAIGFFQNRNLMNGFYIHFLSPDRGVLMYTPVMLFGIVGMVVAYKKKNKYLGLCVAIIGLDVLLYSLWDDPYGGWAFGSRYLIPTYALSSIFIGFALTAFRKYNLFLLAFFGIFVYSIGVNTLGALTSNSNPPKVEADALSLATHTDVPYTYIANMHMLDAGYSKSFVFDAFARQYMSAWSYYAFLTVFITLVAAFLIVLFKASMPVEESAISVKKSRVQQRRLTATKGEIYAV